jgi:predicted transglutaminase-like cysteine proteinase
MSVLKIFIILVLFLSVTLDAKPYVNKRLMKKITKKYKIFGKKRFVYLQKTLDKVKNKDDMAKLKAVNDYFNKVHYASDMKVYGKKDYWATPWEFLGKDKGDCEDYVISKYFALIYLGIDSKKLFFTYVRSSKFSAAHMVLTYFKTPRSEPLVLDNTNFKIFPASKRKDLTPIYNFNGDSLYKAKKAGNGKKVKSQKAHKKWDQLLKHMQEQRI